MDHLDGNELVFHIENHQEGRPDSWNKITCLWAIEWDDSLHPYPGYEGYCSSSNAYKTERVSMKGKKGKGTLRVFATYRFSKDDEGFHVDWYREVAHIEFEVK
jgi:hypothetical protein